MGTKNLFLLLVLSAIWGASFMFMRYLSPILGPVATADMRLLIGGGALVLLFLFSGFGLEWRRNWRRFLIIGLLNSGIPFLLYSFAALSLPASIEVIVNSMAPIFGAVFSAIWLAETLTPIKTLGLLLGTGGVLVVSGFGGSPNSPPEVPALLACVLAAACYGLAGIYIKKFAKDIPPKAIAAGSQFIAGAALLPLVFFFPPSRLPRPGELGILVLFALLCSAIAYLIYYRLIAETGPTKALTVTFLMPVFGMLWGYLILKETISLSMLGGTALILLGTRLVATSPSKGKILKGRSEAGKNG